MDSTNNSTELLKYLRGLHGLHTSMVSFIIRKDSDLNLEKKKLIPKLRPHRILRIKIIDKMLCLP